MILLRLCLYLSASLSRFNAGVIEARLGDVDIVADFPIISFKLLDMFGVIILLLVGDMNSQKRGKMKGNKRSL